MGRGLRDAGPSARGSFPLPLPVALFPCLCPLPFFLASALCPLPFALTKWGVFVSVYQSYPIQNVNFALRSAALPPLS